MKCLILSIIILLCGCASDRQLYEFEELDVKLNETELNTELTGDIAPKPSLPPFWRGRKLFTSPWAYIYAKDKESAAYAYDELASLSEDKDKVKSYGIIIVTGANDSETAFDYLEIKKLYEAYIKNEDLLAEEKSIFEEDLKGLNTIKKFHSDVYAKADEKKDENSLKQFRESIDQIITYATFFIQPEIMQEYMQHPIDESIYWCAFISVDDTIDENLDGIVSAILNDYEVSTIGKGLVWSVISPGLYFKKRKVIKETQKTFADGYKKNALLKQGIVKYSDRAIKNYEPEGVNGSE